MMINEKSSNEIKNEIRNENKIDKSNIRTQKKKTFNVETICKSFEEFNKEDSLPLDHYINGYKELSNFFENLGTIFSFVASDVDSKLIILENYRADKENGKYYCDIRSMIDFEKTENLFKTTKNGTRNLLRLHRALQFISEFLNEVTKLNENENTNLLAIASYERSLMKYHSWVVSKAAKLAMYTLPNRSLLVQRVFQHNQEQMTRDQINESMLRISKLTEQAFNSTQRLYEEQNLLDLP